jgi:hypothetical protein
LPGHRGADNQGNANGDSEVDRDSRIPDVRAHRLPGEIDAGNGAQVLVFLNSISQLMN